MKELNVDPKAKALIFDLDGTLGDTMPVHYLAYKNVLKNYDIDFTPELFYSLAGIPAVETVQKLNEMFGTKLDPQDTGHRKEDEYEKMMHKMTPVEPVVRLVKQYYGKLPMSVGTGGYKRLAWKALDILGLAGYFDILISSEDVKNPKPHPETFLICAQKMGVSPEFCQVFEDGELGIQAADAAGMMSVLVTDFYDVSVGKQQ